MNVKTTLEINNERKISRRLEKSVTVPNHNWFKSEWRIPKIQTLLNLNHTLFNKIEAGQILQSI